MKTKIIVISGVIALVAIGILFKITKTKTGTPSVPDTASLAQAPDFSLQDYNGKTVKLSDFAGKPLVINSWAAWCPFCRKELVDFAAVQKEFGDKIVIIAVDRAESLATAKKYSDEVGVTNDLIFLLDPGDSFYQSIGGFSMPETIFVDANGDIKIHKRGPMDLNEIREKITLML